MFSRSRLWRWRRPRTGTRRSCSTWSGGRTASASSPGPNSNPSSTCCRRGSAPSAGAAARFFTEIVCTVSSAAGGERVSPRLRPAEPSPTMRSISCSPSRTRRWSARSTRTSPSRAWRATCFCSARRRGAFVASRPAGSGWKTRRERRRRSRSGGVRPPDGPRSCRPLSRRCARGSSSSGQNNSHGVRPHVFSHR